MSPSLLPASPRGKEENSECSEVRLDFTAELHALQSIRNPLDNVLCHHTWQVDPEVLSFVGNVTFAHPGSPGCKM